MPSQLFANEAVGFLACKPFTYRGEEYAIGDEFPQEEANNIETLVRARYVIPFVEDLANKPRHWHTHIRSREQAEEYLNRSRVQLRMPAPPDSDEVVNLNVLTHPETTPEPEVADQQEDEDEPEEESEEGEFDPADHTVNEVQAYLAEHPEERERVLASEAEGRGRKGLLED